MRDRFHSAPVFAGWHSVVLFFIHPVHQTRCFVSSVSSTQVSETTKRLLLILPPPVFSYYIGLGLDHGYGQLNGVIALSEVAISMLMTFLHVACLGLTDTVQSDLRLQLSVFDLEALSASVVKLRKAVDVCHIVEDTRFDMAALLMARNSIKCVDWTVASSVSTSQLLLFVMQTSTVSAFFGKVLPGLCSQARAFLYLNHGYMRLRFQNTSRQGSRFVVKQRRKCIVNTRFVCFIMLLTFSYSCLIRCRKVLLPPSYWLSRPQLSLVLLVVPLTCQPLRLLTITVCVRLFCQLLTSPTWTSGTLPHLLHRILL